MKPDNENRGWRAAISQHLVGPRATQFSSSRPSGSPNCPTGGARSTASRDRGSSSFFSKLSAIPVLMFSAFVGITPAHAVPSFARQTGMTCNACHTTIPELTAFGRQFKMGGYTEKVDGAPKFPLAMWMMGGFSHARKPLSTPPLANSNKTNNITSLDQISIFLAGKLFDNVGAFIQLTYDPNAHAWGWDNTDIRYTRTGTLFGKSATYGLSLNNNPTVQDPWATLPAWGYPAFDSAVMPEYGLPGTLLQGTLAQQVLGLTGHVSFDNGLYAEFGGYSGLSQGTLKSLGAAGAGFGVGGLAPYLRIAKSQDVGGGTLMVGGIAMMANLEPNYTGALGKDRYIDLGLDSQFDYQGSNYGLTFKARDIMEWQHLTATHALGNSTNVKNRLNTLDLSLTYYKPKWAVIGAYSNVTGTSDAALYGPNSVANSPNGSSVSIEANYSPWMGGSPFSYKDTNLKFGVKYTHFLKLYGGTSNFDGKGHNAAGNDYVFLYTLFAF